MFPLQSKGFLGKFLEIRNESFFTRCVSTMTQIERLGFGLFWSLKLLRIVSFAIKTII